MQSESQTLHLTHRLQQALALVLLVLAAAGMLGHGFIGLSPDHESLFRSTQMMLSGNPPYIAYADINPPLIHLFYNFPALTSSLLGVPEYVSLALWVNALLLLSCYMVYALLTGQIDRLSRALIALLIATVLSIISYQHQVFGDRDHLMLCLIMPWLVLHAPFCHWQQVPTRLRRIAAIMAALGFALKPHFAILYPALVLYYHHRMPLCKQLAQREHHLIWFIGSLYLFITALGFHDYIYELLLLIIYTYPHYSWTLDSKLEFLSQMLAQDLLPAVIWLLAAFFIIPAQRPFLYFLALLNLMGAALYVCNAGWPYTYYTLLAFNTLTIPACAWCIITKERWHNTALMLLWVVLAAATTVSTHFYPSYQRAQEDIYAQQKQGHPTSVVYLSPRSYRAIHAFLGEKSRYMFLSTHLRSNILTLAYPDYTPVGRYDHLWPLPGLAYWQDKMKSKRLYNMLQTRFIKGLTYDIIELKPDHIVVETSMLQPPLPIGFQIIPFLQQYKPFAVVWSRYHLVRRYDVCSKEHHLACAFDIYAREEGLDVQ